MPEPLEVPPPAEWPVEVRNLIARRLVARTLAPWGSDRKGRALGWERLLVSTYAGTERRGVRLPFLLTVAEAYAFALEDATRPEDT